MSFEDYCVLNLKYADSSTLVGDEGFTQPIEIRCIVDQSEFKYLVASIAILSFELAPHRVSKVMFAAMAGSSSAPKHNNHLSITLQNLASPKLMLQFVYLSDADVTHLYRHVTLITSDTQCNNKTVYRLIQEPDSYVHVAFLRSLDQLLNASVPNMMTMMHAHVPTTS